jgi:hypothetical protein
MRENTQPILEMFILSEYPEEQHKISDVKEVMQDKCRDGEFVLCC